MSKPIFILGLSVFLFSCNTYRNAIGTYRSNYTVPDNNETTLILKTDSTFECTIKGNSIYDSSFGKYQIREHRLFLYSIWEKTGQYRWSLMERASKNFIAGQDTIEYQSIFYFSNDRLYATNFETGKRLKKEVGYHEQKKYLLFGGHYYKKEYYLKKTDGAQ